MKEIKKHQIKYIHTLKSKLNLKEENYRSILESKFNKNSCKDLTEAQASVLITLLEKEIELIGLATEKQLGKFNTLYKKNFSEENKNDFIRSYLGKGKNEKNMTIKECSKLIYILENIVRWHEKKIDEENIELLKSKAKLTDKNFRSLLKSKFNKNNYEELTKSQTSFLITLLKREIELIGLATEKQLEKFNTLYKKNFGEENRNDFIRSYLGKDKNEKNMTVKECSKLIYILENIIDK